ATQTAPPATMTSPPAPSRSTRPTTRPVAESILSSSPSAVAQTDPRPTARLSRPEVSRSTAVMTLPDTGSMRTTCGNPCGPAATPIQTCVPSLATGPLIGTSSPTLFVTGSIRTTALRPRTSVKTPLGPTVMVFGPPLPGALIGIVATTVFVLG